MSWTNALPAIAQFITGPAGGIAAAGIQFLADKLGAKEATVDAIKSTLQGWTPEQLLKAKEIDTEFQKFAMDNGIKIQLAQIAVNVEEAKSSNWFVSGWRPACGWVGAFALLYAAILEPFARFIAVVGFNYTGMFPSIDTSITMQVLFGLLGLGAYRTVEKVRGAEGNR